MFGNGRGWDWGACSPRVGQDQARRSGRNDDAGPQNRAGHRSGERLVGLAGLFLLGQRAAAIRLRLGDGLRRGGTVRGLPVHGARLAVVAARHACFRRGGPTVADGRLSGRYGRNQHQRSETAAEGQHMSRMRQADGGVNVVTRSIETTRRFRDTSAPTRPVTCAIGANLTRRRRLPGNPLKRMTKRVTVAPQRVRSTVAGLL